jgi:hypothetical protein
MTQLQIPTLSLKLSSSPINKTTLPESKNPATKTNRPNIRQNPAKA